MSNTIIKLNSGILFDILNPNPENILISDIAWALANLCRFNGHVPEFYSVGEHSIAVMDMVVQREYKLTALLHDATEAYIGDVTRPLKQLLPEYISIENNLNQFIANKFGLVYPFPDEVKNADNEMLRIEQLWIDANGHVLTPLRNPFTAYEQFMKAFERYSIAH